MSVLKCQQVSAVSDRFATEPAFMVTTVEQSIPEDEALSADCETGSSVA